MGDSLSTSGGKRKSSKELQSPLCHADTRIDMPLETWMLRTVLVILAINGVNVVLFWIARRWQGGIGAAAGPSARVPPLSANGATGWRQAPSDRAARHPAHLPARGSLRRGGLDFVRVMHNAVPRSAGEPLRTKSHASPGH